MKDLYVNNITFMSTLRPKKMVAPWHINSPFCHNLSLSSWNEDGDMHERCTHTTVLVTITPTLVNGVMNLTMHSFKTSCRPCTYDQPVLDSSSVILHSMNNDHFIHSTLFNHSQKILSIILPFSLRYPLELIRRSHYPIWFKPYIQFMGHSHLIHIHLDSSYINQHNTPTQYTKTSTIHTIASTVL